ncbi:MAG TPA: hypothetical protein VIL35_14280 [Vicinamibacterales bacterium]
MTQSAIALLVAALAIVSGIAALSLRTLSMPGNAPDRLVAELRLAQVAALVLALTAGASLGLVASHGDRAGLTLEVAAAMGVFVVATAAPFRDPRVALTWLALGFGAHAVLDVLHRPGLLPDSLAPAWYIVGCSLKDVLLGALCYLPLLRR